MEIKETTVDIWPHPLTDEGRRTVVAREGASVSQVINQSKMHAPAVRAWIDGDEVPAELLDSRILQQGEIMTLRADVTGSGADKVLRQLLTIAVIAAAIFVPPLLGFAAGSVGAALVGAGVMVVGTLLVNALVPPEVPKLDGPGGATASPVYSLSGGSNQLRQYAPLLMVLGEHRVFPDLAAAEYAIFQDGEQYLHQIFDFGLGNIEVSDLRSGPNLLSGFDGVDLYWGLNGAEIPRIAGNVDTEAGAELTDTTYITRTMRDAFQILIDVVARLFRIDEEGETQNHTVSIQVQWSATGQPSGTQTFRLDSSSQTQLRKTLVVNPIRAVDWTVRVRRTTAAIDKDADNLSSEDSRTYDDVAVTAMRALQPDTGDYTGRNRLGIRFKASAQLQGRLNRISGIVKQKVPVWENNRWSAPKVTSNPAWILRWFALGHTIAGRLTGGRGLDSSRIDDEKIKAWGAWCEAKNLKCDYVLDRPEDVDDVQRMIARCGRASPSWQTGKFGVVWDAENQTPVAMMHPGNIVQGSVGVEWLDTKVADEVIVRYIEPGMDWQWNSIRRTVPGTSGIPQQSTTVNLNGVVSADQAASIAGLMAAGHKYHKRRVTWEMAAEGLSIRRGNVIWMSHSLIDGGITGRLAAGSTVSIVNLDQDVTLPTGRNYLQLRMIDGTIHTSAVSAGASQNQLRLATAIATQELLNEPVDTLWRLYDATPPAKFKVISVEPLSDRAVRMVAIDERAEYYAAANQSQAITGQSRGLPEVLWISAAKRLVRAGSGYVLEIEIVLTVKGAWDGAQIRVGRGTASSVRVIKELRNDDLSATWIEDRSGTITISAIPRHEGGLHVSGAKSLDFNLSGGLYDIAPPTDFAVVQLPDGTRRFGFTPPADPDLAGIVIRYAATPADNSNPAWGAMTPAHKGTLTVSPWETVDIDAGDWSFAARSLSTAGDLSEIVRTNMTLDDVSIGGQRWLSGSGAPPSTLGNNGDLYLDESTSEIYKKTNNAWRKTASLSNADGATWLFGRTAPSNSLGDNGQFYLITGSTDAAGNIYYKSGGRWRLQVDIHGADGSTILGGTGAPASSLGRVGDWYFRSSNGFVYEKTGSITWRFRRDSTGPQGIQGLPGMSVPQTIGIGAIRTSNIALSATTDLSVNQFAGPFNSRGPFRFNASEVVIPGGSQVLITFFFSMDDDGHYFGCEALLGTGFNELNLGQIILSNHGGVHFLSGSASWKGNYSRAATRSFYIKLRLYSSPTSGVVSRLPDGGHVDIHTAMLNVYVAKR